MPTRPLEAPHGDVPAQPRAAAGWFSDRVAREAPLVKGGVSRVAGVVLVALGVWTAYRAIVAWPSLL